MPMVPEAVDRDAGLRAARRDPLGRVRRLRGARARGADRRRQAAVVLSASCGIEGARVVAYKPLLDAALELRPRTRPSTAWSCSARSSRPTWPRAATSTGPSVAGTPSRPCVPVPRPTRSTSSTPRARPAARRASCATTAATPSRCAGACPTSTTSRPGDVFWAASDVGWVVGHSYIVYAPLLAGATTVLYEGKPVGTPDAGAFWRVIERVRRGGAVHRADRDPRDPQGGSRRRAARGRYDLPSLRTLFLAGERPTRTRYAWASRDARRPGDRPLVADRDRLADRGQLRGLEPMPVKAGSPTRAGARATTCGPRRATAAPVPAGDEGAIADPAAAAARAPADAVERRRALRGVLPRPRSPATT